jgi:multicomponent Na+:H+ antiporter subunit F
MNTLSSSWFQWVLAIAFGNLCLSLLLVSLRLMLGPSLPDRVVSLDLLAILAAGFIALYSISAHQPVYLDVAITLTLIAFLSTVAFARYVQQMGIRKSLEKRAKRKLM